MYYFVGDKACRDFFIAFFCKPERLQLTWLDRVAYECFKSLFIRANVLDGCMQRKNNSLSIVGGSLMGACGLWNLVFNALDPTVRDDATDFLVEVYSSVSDSLRGKMEELTSTLVRNAFHHLETNPTETERMDRVLRIVQRFVVAYANMLS